MVTRLEEIDPSLADAIDQSMLLSESARPASREHVLQRFRLSQPGEWVTQDVLNEFKGAERRYQLRGVARGVTVVDDYGHHPTEIAAVMAAARATLGRRLVIAFQPHRHSRTAHLLEAFGPALRDADEIVLADIYGAGEEPIPGVTVERLAESIRVVAAVADCGFSTRSR